MDQLRMLPAPGARLVRFAGDFLEFSLTLPDAARRHAEGWSARLRTNVGRAADQQREIVESRFTKVSLAGASWRDLPMHWDGAGWRLAVPLTEVGYFQAKAYLLDPVGRQQWPPGADVGVSVHPEHTRTGNTIYCAFPRMFGTTRTKAVAADEKLDKRLHELDEKGFHVIPPSGKLRDLQAQLPFIIGELGCRVVHLLPVNPTPTTMARMGRFGSPYAVQDLTGIDPALVDFDGASTGVEQFCDLVHEAHRLGGRVFLDLVVNHTGWGSTLFENHPEWFVRGEDGAFESPGAWGVTWGDLVELAHRDAALWEHLAEVFLTWCRRGVDGFRCDAGYKVPTPAWQHIIARVRQEFPGAVFLLEGLGGAWFDTERLLCEGGMQWAYSELFQEFNGPQVAGYLDHAFQQSARAGVLVHYSETHDNDRLAAKGRAWSLLRNRLCALTSVNGGFGFTCGVEWLAAEKIKVHESRGLNWGASKNLVAELARLNQLLATHPCFFDGAKLTRLSDPASAVYALLRESAEGPDAVLVLVNTDAAQAQTLILPATKAAAMTDWRYELLGQAVPQFVTGADGTLMLSLAAGACFCLSARKTPAGLAGDDYVLTRRQAARALAALTDLVHLRHIGFCDWRKLAGLLCADPVKFLAAVACLEPDAPHADPVAELEELMRGEAYPAVVEWTIADLRRHTVLPAGHWLLVRDEAPFRARLTVAAGEFPENLESIPVNGVHVAWFPPRSGGAAGATLELERFGEGQRRVTGQLVLSDADAPAAGHSALPAPDDLVLLTNGRGGMARMCVDLGRVTSKYDCVLAANLDRELPVDRHVFVKRVRAWVDADGFITPLDFDNLFELQPGPPAVWRFVASAGDGRSVEIQLVASMIPGENTTVLRFERPAVRPPVGRELPPECRVHLTVRFDLEDRNFHWETKRNPAAEHHFTSHLETLQGRAGFSFTPAPDRQLEVWSLNGRYHSAPEWSEHLPHPVEASRGMTGEGDGYSPGWFELPLHKGESVDLLVTADHRAPFRFDESVLEPPDVAAEGAGSRFSQALARAVRAFVVRRGEGRTVIAGYPWFLDWGRDTLICARGLLAAGLVDEVHALVRVFARFEANGTLPNTIHGANASNRDTSDAPLWFGVVCDELAGRDPERRHKIFREVMDEHGRTLADILKSIAVNCLQGTPNGIRADAASGLLWSPSHFTWMDTNHPAGTPREGYPVEIQALWIRLLRLLEGLGVKAAGRSWTEVAAQAEASFAQLFWLPEQGWFADVLAAGPGVAAAAAEPDDALRSNFLLAVSLGVATGARARQAVDAARRHLVIPGALRSLAPLPVKRPLPVRSADGTLLNNPSAPYWGCYEGDEDSRRKPAYHNGTAWTWTFPVFCEALAAAWEQAPGAVAAARSYLETMEPLLRRGCLGQLPEVMDGDAPHPPRGCDAQAWGATEALRVWHSLHAREPAR